jgi:hypothetical protein
VERAITNASAVATTVVPAPPFADQQQTNTFPPRAAMNERTGKEGEGGELHREPSTLRNPCDTEQGFVRNFP